MYKKNYDKIEKKCLARFSYIWKEIRKHVDAS